MIKKAHYYVIALIIFIIIYAGANLVWLIKDSLPPPFDQSAHLLIAHKFHQLLNQPQKLSLTKLLGVTNYWPPFFHFSAALVTRIIGFSSDTVALTNFLFLIFLAIALFKIGENWFSPAAGLLAVFLTLMSPLVFGLVRDNLVDFCLLSTIVCIQYLIIKSRGGWDKKYGLLLGLSIGCSLLTKWTSPVFFAFTAMFVFLETWVKQKKPFTGALIRALIVIFVASAIFLPWYLKNLTDFRVGAQHALFVDSRLEGDPISFWPSLTWYLLILKEVIITNWLLPFFLLGLIFYFVWEKNKEALIFSLAWICPALFVFIIIPNKDARFILPLLPALALLSAAGLNSFPWKKSRLILMIILIVLASYQFVAISFGWPDRIEHSYAFQASPENWPIEDILAALASSFPGKEARLAILANQPYFNPNTFRYFSAIKNYPFEIEEIGGRPVNFTQLLGYHFLILKTGEIALEHTARYRLEFLNKFWLWLEEGKKYPSFSLWKKWPLPDGSEALIYEIKK